MTQKAEQVSIDRSIEPLDPGAVHQVELATGRVSSLAGEPVLVTGAGTIGNLVAQAARCRGAKKVMITEPLVTGHFSLEEYEEACRFIDEQGATTLKVVIDLD
jgi:threonine dehydrogenase-like Zn-dependent dehydrogenase